MKISRVFLAVSLASLPLLNGCGGGNAAATKGQTQGEAPAPSPASNPYRVEVVSEHEAPINAVTAPGKIEANSNRISRVMPPVTGRITQVLVKFGDAVKENQPVAILESPEADAAVSNVLQAEGGAAQAVSALTKAEADLERLRDLFEHKAIARKELLQVEKEAAQARAGVMQAEAALNQCLRRLEILEIQKDLFGQKIVVRAPIPGKVLEVHVAPGEFRNDPNSPLMTIADLSTVWISADVPENVIRFIQKNERVTIELTAYPGEKFSGRVTQISDVVDPETRSVKVRAEIDNRGGRLRPEMYGQIRHTDSTRRLPAVPIPAVVQVRGHSAVYVETRPGAYEQREVKTGDRMGELVPILSGLQPGERVVVDGALLLKRN